MFDDELHSTIKKYILDVSIFSSRIGLLYPECHIQCSTDHINLNQYLYSGFLELGINLYTTQIYYTLENRYPVHENTVIQGAS